MSGDRVIEFAVAGFADRNHQWIGGRSYRGEIHTGDVFQSIFRYEFSNEVSKPIRVAWRRVELTIRSIEAYGRKLRSLPEGMSGQLFFEQADWADLREGDVLCSSEPPTGQLPSFNKASRPTCRRTSSD